MSGKREGFYKALEDRFRGDREMIKLRLQVYLPFIEPLKDVYQDARAVDLGCGRGEWLELLGENGFAAQGVDVDDNMLAACTERGLDAHKTDALSFLKHLGDESVSVVSGFHLVEHLPFDDLHSLVEESLRVLKPGGLLLLETPNPENIVVATAAFYLDPTHIKPIPPSLLAFVAEYYQFRRVKILRLQESKDIENSDNIALLNVFDGVSPDYALVAQKDAAGDVLGLIGAAFEAEYGVTLDRLASKFESRVYNAESMGQQAKATAEEAMAKAAQAEAWATQADAKAAQAEDASRQYLMQLHAVYASTSWRITAPLRSMGRAVRRLRRPGAGVSSSLEKKKDGVLQSLAAFTVNRGVNYARKSPRFRRVVQGALIRMPGLSVRLRQRYSRSRLSAHARPEECDDGMASNAQIGISVGPALTQAMASAAPDGVNAQQRTPVEAYFHVYGERQ